VSAQAEEAVADSAAMEAPSRRRRTRQPMVFDFISDPSGTLAGQVE